MIMKNVFLHVLAAFTFVVGITSCSNDDKIDNGSSQIVARGIINEEVLSKAVVTENPIAFKGNDIAWFNSSTREIKLNNIDPYSILSTYQKISFEVDGTKLFTVNTVATDAQSFVCYDIVLYYDLESGKYYLLDAYPDFAIENEETKKNSKAREENWNKFTTQLQKERRLK